MSSVEHPKEYYNIPIIKKDKYSMLTEMIHTPYNGFVELETRCCDNCEYFDTFAKFDLRDEDGLCLKNVANDEYGEYINDSDTFYCSYHKFKV